MAVYVEVPDILYKGVKVYTLQEGTTESTPPTSEPVTPTQSAVISYPVQSVTLTDAMYLYKMQSSYASALKALPGSHQLFLDILTVNGKTYWQATGTTQQSILLAVNRVINLAGSDHAAETTYFNVATYTGPLKQIYNNLVQAKLQGKA